MNRKAALLFILLIAVLTALAVFDSFRNPLLTFSSPTGTPMTSLQDQTADPSKKTFVDFMTGADEYVHMVVPADACSRTPGVNQIFCLQGYYTAANSNLLRKVKPAENLKLDAEIPTQPKNSGILRHIWYSTLGMAVAQAALDPVEYSKYIDPKHIPHFAEGWAFFAFTLYGASATSAKCDFDFQGANRAACQFGMGQAAYFNKSELANVQYTAADLAPGFLFTQALVNPEVEATADKKSKMSKVAKVITDLWDGKPTDSTHRNLAECLEANHPVECSKYY